MSKKKLRFAAIVLIILIVDQTTKVWINNNFYLYQSKEVVNGLLNITYLLNRGAAFGLLADSGSLWVPVFFIIIGILALIVILYVVREYNEVDVLPNLSFAMIFGGALGNLIDRIIRGEVIDFIDFHLGMYHWPTFNVADSCITIGVFLFIFFQIKQEIKGTAGKGVRKTEEINSDQKSA